MKRLLIIGAGGHGKVVADAACARGWQEIGFVDRLWPQLQAVSGWPVVGGDAQLAVLVSQWDAVFVAVGDNRTREALMQQVRDLGGALINIVHPGAVVSDKARLGIGILVAANAVINIDAEIEDGAIINTAAVVEHDCRIGRCVHISPSACLAGDVCVGARSWIGMGSNLIPGVRVGGDVRVGAGAVVVGDLADGVTALGVPAREING